MPQYSYSTLLLYWFKSSISLSGSISTVMLPSVTLLFTGACPIRGGFLANDGGLFRLDPHDLAVAPDGERSSETAMFFDRIRNRFLHGSPRFSSQWVLENSLG